MGGGGGGEVWHRGVGERLTTRDVKHDEWNRRGKRLWDPVDMRQRGMGGKDGGPRSGVPVRCIVNTVCSMQYHANGTKRAGGIHKTSSQWVVRLTRSMN